MTSFWNDTSCRRRCSTTDSARRDRRGVYPRHRWEDTQIEYQTRVTKKHGHQKSKDASCDKLVSSRHQSFFFLVECFWNVLRNYTSLSRSGEHLNFAGLTSATDYAFLTSALASVRPFFASPLAVNLFHQKLRIARQTLSQQKLWDCQVVA